MTHTKQVKMIAVALTTSLMTGLTACDALPDRKEEDGSAMAAEPETMSGTQPDASRENPEPAGDTVMPVEPAGRTDPAGISKRTSRPSASPTVAPSPSAVPKEADASAADEHAGHDMDSMPGHEMDNH